MREITGTKPMSPFWERFFEGSEPPLRWGALGFLILAIAVAIAFSIDYGPENPVSYFALGLAIIGLSIGVVSIAWGWVTVLRSILRPRPTEPPPTPAAPPRDPKIPLSGPGGL